MAEEQKKLRNPRTTKKQIEIIVNFMEDNPKLLQGTTASHEMAIIEQKWKELTELLNSSCVGPVKTVTQWRSVVKELKTNVKKRAREVHLANIGTGGGPKKVKNLTDIEERLLILISKIVIEGAPGILEPGIVEENNKEMEIMQHNEVLNIEATDVEMELPPEKNDSASTTKTTNKFPNTRRKSKRKIDNWQSTAYNQLTVALNQQSNSMNNLAVALNSVSSGLNNLAASINNLAQIRD